FWGAVVDNKFCVGHPFERFLRNERWNVPILWGNTTDEFISRPQVGSIEELRQMAEGVFGEDADRFLALCGADSGDLEQALKAASVNTIEYAIRVASRANAAAGAGTPLYYYKFDAEIPGWDNPGTFHSVDLWFFFETLAKCWRPFVGKHYDLARQMCNYWAHFIRSGDPNGPDSTGEDLPRWEPYTEEAPYAMVFGDKSEFVREQPGEMIRFLVEQYFKRK
ncbi:MAG: carboxylesterase, partial [Paenibacillaceae bacterium]